jgi:two-component sensor histidine kinase
MNEIIKLRAEKHLYYMCLAAIPLWLIWILFDYWFGAEDFTTFLITRLVGCALSALAVLLIVKQKIDVFVLQLFLFAFYNGLAAFYVSFVPESALSFYFTNYILVVIVVFIILIIRFKEIIWYSILAAIGFVALVVWGEHSLDTIMGNGGFSYLTILVLMILFSWLKWQGLLRDVSLAAEIEKARETEELNKTLEQANREKETLLQEIHHRVKNNLQLVSSLLNLQKNYTDDEKIREILQDSRQRVSSMSRIHETLYSSNNFSSINISSYLKELANNIIFMYSDETQNSIVLDADMDDLTLNISDAMPIGLIANEIITNSIKHAFPDNQTGKICIVLKKHENHFDLIISDDGIGMDLLAHKNRNSLGQELVTMLVEQIDAQMNVQVDKGTVYSLRVPFN